MGYEKDQLVSIFLEGQLQSKFEVFKERLVQNQDIKSVTRSSHNLLGRNSNTGDVSWEGKDPDFTALFEIMNVDYGFLETTGIQSIQGSDFARDRGSDLIQSAIINRKAFELISQNNPDANSINTWGAERQILGVVKDFHFQSFRQSMEPVIIVLNSGFASNSFVRVNPEKMQETLEYIRAVATEMNPEFPFQHTFMDENYARLYQDDIKIRELAKYFSILTILISCLGLLGLSAHIAEQKTKEIGIRKVLGASTFSILQGINKEFIAIVSISILLGSGIAYWVMQDWLKEYAFQFVSKWWFIPLVAATILGIALATVTLQSLKAASSNPVNSLKSE